MTVLFLTLLDFSSLYDSNIYTDLLLEFLGHGHSVYVISPVERSKGEKTHLIRTENTTILKLRIGNTQKAGLLEKGISTLRIESAFRRGIKRYFTDVKFDLVLYSTPPITLVGAVEYIKRRDSAKTYLLLKDIFPQNAIDIGIMSKSGIKGLIYRYFRVKERRLYKASDRIGCMSQANVKYLCDNNSDIDPKVVMICPNSIRVIDKSIGADIRSAVRNRYGIPTNKVIFVYGGNLGKPQDIPFVIECIRKSIRVGRAFFLVIGDGTEYGIFENFEKEADINRFRLMKRLPKEDYDLLIAACDVGLIFLDYRFTIPNFPSRLLGYMQAKLPILAATDRASDVGKVIEEGGFGKWCPSNNSDSFVEAVEGIANGSIQFSKDHEYMFLEKEYSTEKSYEIIMKSIGAD